MTRVDGEIVSSEKKLALADKRRARNAAENRCINDTKARSHGPRVEGRVRCAWCIAVHKYGAEKARAIVPESARVYLEAS